MKKIIKLMSIISLVFSITILVSCGDKTRENFDKFVTVIEKTNSYECNVLYEDIEYTVYSEGNKSLCISNNRKLYTEIDSETREYHRYLFFETTKIWEPTNGFLLPYNGLGEFTSIGKQLPLIEAKNGRIVYHIETKYYSDSYIIELDDDGKGAKVTHIHTQVGETDYLDLFVYTNVGSTTVVSPI